MKPLENSSSSVLQLPLKMLEEGEVTANMEGSNMSIAKYLFTRLRKLGVTDIHGVPGDFTLKALDHLKASGIRWIGSCNELNAGYAADGYARIKGLGALFTTYGVGELSAINAVAGSYAEHVPVVHIVGSPARRLHSGAAVHHTLGDGRSRIFAEIHEKVTVAQAHLWDPDTAPEMIDRVLEQCLTESRPVYIEMPCDVVPIEVPVERLIEEITVEATELDTPKDNETVDMVLERIYSARQPMILVDRGHGMPQVRSEINELVQQSGIPTLTLPSGAGMVDHSLKNYYGVHAGPVGQIDTMPFMDASDFVLAFGPMFSDSQTLGWSTVPDPKKTIIVPKDIEGTPIKRFLRTLIDRLDVSRIPESDVSSLGNFRTIKAPSANPDAAIDQDTLYLRLNSYFQPDDTILLGNATPILGGRDFILPPGARVIASGMWFSIGHMLPAAQGVAAAQKGKGRTILFDGDGSFQVTVQELSTVIRYKLDMTIFIINKDGYAYERLIHGRDADYNDLARWRYLDAPAFFGAKQDDDYPVETHRIETWKDLDQLLGTKSFHDGKGLKLVEVVVGRYDVPEKFKEVFRKAGEQL